MSPSDTPFPDKPIILAVDHDAGDLAAIERELTKRYGSDYSVVCLRSPGAALDLLRRASISGAEVALVLADARIPEMEAVDFFRRARLVEPRAKRAMLAGRGDAHAIETAMTGSAFGQVDHRLAKPREGEPDERFHSQISELLYDWARVNHRGREMIRVVGEQWSQRSHEIRDALWRNGVEFGFYDIETSEGRALLHENGLEPSTTLPVAMVRDGPVLTDPSNREVAEALGFVSPPPSRVVDLVVIGAGPAGLGAALYGASEGLDTLVIEREALGGQAGQASLISNFMGFPGGISGQELMLRTCEQAILFGARFLATRDTVALRHENGTYEVHLDGGGAVRTRTVIVATGVSYRRLDVAALERLRGAGVFYGSATSEARLVEGMDVFIVGAGNSAGQGALHLSRYARSVTIISRRDALAHTMSSYLVTRLRATENVAVRLHTRIADGGGDDRLADLVLEDLHNGRLERVPAQALFVMIGAVPHTDWLPSTMARDRGGYLLTGNAVTTGEHGEPWPLRRAPLAFETSRPGVFAAGDVRHGSLQRVVSAASDGAMTVRNCYELLNEAGGELRPERAA
ncbi:MAG: FAD-dependent oxidoreductase [Thermoleophilia bacterium]